MKNKLKDRHHFAVINSIIDKFTMLVSVSTGHDLISMAISYLNIQMFIFHGSMKPVERGVEGCCHTLVMDYSSSTSRK